jgi:ribonuclease R
MLHLELPETEIIMDKQGKVVDAKPADASYPHTIIEMFMVEANEAVASLLDRFNVPFLRRIHPDPDVLSTKNLSRFVSLCGIKVPRQLDRKAIQNLLAAVKNTPAELAINLHVLRSLSKAEYSPLNIGHYALASQHYTHFTSPIRRYADLMIHRLLECYLRQQLNKGGIDEVLPEQELIEIGKHISFTEQRSENAEKELKTVLILQMLGERTGELLECVVTGLTNFGIFVQSQRFGIEGLIPLENLGPDSWRYDDTIHSVVGERSGVKVRLGEPMVVQIVSVNIPARQLNVIPAEPLTKGRPTDKKTKFASARAGRRKNQPRKTTSSRTPGRRKKDRGKR